MACFDKVLLWKHTFITLCINKSPVLLIMGLLIFRKRGEQQGDIYIWTVPPGLQTGGCGASLILYKKPWLYNHDPQPPWVRTFGLQGPCYCFSGKFKMQVTECGFFFFFFK